MSSIDPSVKTSRVFDATSAVFARLTEVSFPPHPVGEPRPVPVFLFREPAWEADEYVTVRTTDDPALNDWILSGPASSEEQIVVDVTVVSWRPATDADDGPNEAAIAVLRRLEELADVVQMIAWDPVTNRVRPIGFSNERVTGRRSSVQFALGHTTEGVVGQALVRFALVAQI